MDNSYWGFGFPTPAWPTAADGQPEKAVPLCHCADNLAEAEMTISLLAAYGVPCFKYYEKEGAAGKTVNGFSGYGAQLCVPQSRLEEAQELLRTPADDEPEEE